jgi:hypothetical protein
VNGWVLGFTFVVSIITGILFGLARLSRRPEQIQSVASIKVPGHPQRGASQDDFAMLSWFQRCFACVLLIGAGLMLRAF